MNSEQFERLSAFLLEYGAPLLGYARKVARETGGDEKDGEDAFQDLFKNEEWLAKFDECLLTGGEEQACAFAYGSIRMEVRKVIERRFRRKAGRPPRVVLVSPEEIQELQESDAAKQGATAPERDTTAMSNKIAGCWNGLKDKQQAVLERRYFSKPPKTIQETAEELKITPGDVRVTEFRALAKLRDCLEKRGVTRPKDLF